MLHRVLVCLAGAAAMQHRMPDEWRHRPHQHGDPKQNHVIFLATDDMRPEISPYGHKYMRTPAVQALADDGFLFRRAYVQVALCAPSRTVVLTGRRPDRSRVWLIGPYFRDTTGRDWKTLPQVFHESGRFRSIGHGKIFHNGNASGYPLDQDQLYGSWTVPYYHPPYDAYDHYNKSHPPPRPDQKFIAPLSYEGVDAPWQTFQDGMSTLRAIEWIKNASQYETPMFLALGFHRPHIPYVYPKAFEYPLGQVEFPPSNYEITKGVPACAPHDWTGEGATYGDLYALNVSLPPEEFQSNLSRLCDAAPLSKQRAMKAAYYSSIQFVDHLVGQILNALKEEGLYESSTIIFWGDHGYKLGEHCDWFKHDNYEVSTRIPVILKPATSGVAAAALAGVQRGVVVEQLVEEVDIFPTLLELAGLPEVPALEGESWVALLRNQSAPGKTAVFSQYPRYDFERQEQVMGYSVRTAEWRYTEWLHFTCNALDPMEACASASAARPRWGELADVELYDHRGDPATSFSATENENLAHRAEHAKVRASLHAQLVASWAPPASGVCDVVRDFGAVGDNATEDTAAVAAAMASCALVHLPAGFTFLLRPVQLQSHSILNIEGNVVAWPEIATWPNSTDKMCPTTPYATPAAKVKYAPQRESLFWGHNLTNVTIRGNGTIDGQGWRWWPLRNDTTHGDYWHNCRPKLVFIGTDLLASKDRNTDLHVGGITLKDSPFWTFTARNVHGLHISRVHVTTTGCGYNEAPNTDGFNLQGESILIEHARVRNGDDCVPLFPPTRNVTVRNLTCECGNGPAVCVWPRFSLPGSDGDVTGVRFEGVTLNRTNNAVSIKALPSFGGRATNVSFIGMRLSHVRTGVAVNFLGQGLAGRRTPFAHSRAVGSGMGASASDITIEDVSGTVTSANGHFSCLEEEPCMRVRMRNVTLRPAAATGSITPYACKHVQGTAQGCSPTPCGWSGWSPATDDEGPSRVTRR